MYVQQLMMVFPPMSFEMLICLVHEGPYGSLPAGLGTGIIGSVQIRNSELVHEGFYDRGGDRAGHTGKRVDIDNAVISFPGILYYSGYAKTGLSTRIKGEHVLFLKDSFKVRHLVISGQIDEGPNPLVSLSLSIFLVIEVPPVTHDILQVFLHGSES